MNEFCLKLDDELKSIMNSKVMRKYNYPESINEIEELPFNSHNELVQEVKNGNAHIIQGMGDISSTTFFLIAKSYEKILQYTFTSLPYLISIIFLIISFVFSNYFFLVGIIFPFIAGTFTSNFFPLKKIMPIIVIALSVIFYFLNYPTLGILCSGYLVNHFLLLRQRKLHMKVLSSRAMELESAFIFLFGGKKIQLLDKNYKPFIL